MNIYSERVSQIRSLMKEHNIGLYFIPMDDCHGSEYVASHFRCIEFVSGFTGSAGNIIITEDGAWLYADGRYYVQAANQLEGSCISLMKLAAPNVPDPDCFIASQMAEIIKNHPEMSFGFDGNVVNNKLADNFISKIAAECAVDKNQVNLCTEYDLVGEIWKERPAQECTKAWVLDEEYTGESCASKLARIREVITKDFKGEDDYLYLISSLDDAAWIFNIRGNDIPENPECFAYVAITADSARLFLGEDAVSEEIEAYLASQGVQLGVYSKDSLKLDWNKTVLMDMAKMSFSVYEYYRKNGCKIKNISTPSTLMKGIKNPVELKHACNALLRDSAYVTEFMCWLKEKASQAERGEVLLNDDGSAMTELSVDDKLDEFRTKDSLYIEKSFGTIAAYKDNGAMMHYKAVPGKCKEICAEGMLLIDSGVQFKDGTTDITRTFIVGDITEEEKKAFTLTAVSMLRLMNAKFIDGCRGENLDIMARYPMWKEGWDYKCGTGHGVGHVLNVHEGPHNIRWSIGANGPSAKLVEGMVVTDEPGVYREGKFGIRTENEIFVKLYKETDDGKFLCFEPMTYIPVDLDGIDPQYMSAEDKEMLNAYHKAVYEKLSPLLTEKTRNWLKLYTKEI